MSIEKRFQQDQKSDKIPVAPSDEIQRVRDEISKLEQRAAHPWQEPWKKDFEPEILELEAKLRALEVKGKTGGVIEPLSFGDSESEIIVDPRKALDLERGKNFHGGLGEGTRTRQELQKDLREMVAKVHEGFGDDRQAHLAERSEILDTQAEKYGPRVKSFMSSVGERYNGLKRKAKFVAIGALFVGDLLIPPAAPFLSTTSGISPHGQRAVASVGSAPNKHKMPKANVWAATSPNHRSAEKPEHTKQHVAVPSETSNSHPIAPVEHPMPTRSVGIPVRHNHEPIIPMPPISHSEIPASPTPECTNVLPPTRTSPVVRESAPEGVFDEHGFHIDLPNKGKLPESMTNHFGLTISLTEPHIYSGPKGHHLFVFGGTPATQANLIQQYLNEHPKSVVYGTDDSDSYRIPYALDASGNVTGKFPVRTGGFLVFNQSWMKPPGPEDLKSLVQ